MNETEQPAERVRDFYDAVAAEYADHFADELDTKPLDRALLERFAAEVRGAGTVYDLGCGPGGQTTAFLHARGVDVRGVDLSLAAGAEAARRHPRIPFLVADMLDLPLPDGDAAGIVAFYAIVHFGPAQLRIALREMGRVLAPGAPLLLSFHVGDETVHVDEMFGRAASVDFRLHPVERVESALREAGLGETETVVRDAYPGVEHPTRRAYVLARKPAASGDVDR
ncbi:class I SAM-dependent methyltransferase [Longimicrobium sp.]|uniref:class I SAM-dependent methyltransferase n=1 Tax=Longimicrobium sp. TaxID=2029185 RepID=UPI002E2F74FD|nr:class I SAM-dependent methyltransferase [Longimicrobium sp.]HEX6040210.1 class I SAM-dependent methyltransferase [Longimicrobium sp.]